MKILFLNPIIDAEHKLLQSLRGRGHVCLLSYDSSEAYQVLKFHGRTIDLAIVHREVGSTGEGGLELVSKFKGDPEQQDLAYILTTENWTPTQCATHQKSDQGANAYLKWPCTEAQLLDVMDQMFGDTFHAKPSSSAVLANELLLEDVATLFEPASSEGMTSIRLDAPSNELLGLDPFVEAEKQSEVSPNKNTKTKTTVKKSTDSKTKTNQTSSKTQQTTTKKVASSSSSSSGTKTAPPSSKPAADPNKDLSANLFNTDQLFKTVLQSPLEAEALADLGDPNVPFVITDHSPVSSEGPQSQPQTPMSPAEEELLAREMPYLFGSSGSGLQQKTSQPIDFGRAVGDAMIPGGAAHSPDTETVKRFLSLREADVAALSTQLKAAKDQLAAIEEALRQEKTLNAELKHISDDQKRTIEEFERDKELAVESLESEIEELRFQVKTKNDRARTLEVQVREATEEMERLKERVRTDLRKIRVREKELENRLEIMKKDSEALIAARENKIIELKRKIDLLEFNMDLVQDQNSREKENSSKLKERLARALQAVRVAGGLLDSGQPPRIIDTPNQNQSDSNQDESSDSNESDNGEEESNDDELELDENSTDQVESA